MFSLYQQLLPPCCCCHSVHLECSLFTIRSLECSSSTLPHSLKSNHTHLLLCSSVISQLSHTWSHHYISLCPPVSLCLFNVSHLMQDVPALNMDWLPVANLACFWLTLHVNSLVNTSAFFLWLWVLSLSLVVSSCLLWWLFGFSPAFTFSCELTACWTICLKECYFLLLFFFHLFHGCVDYTYLPCVERRIFSPAGLLFWPLLFLLVRSLTLLFLFLLALWCKLHSLPKAPETIIHTLYCVAIYLSASATKVITNCSASGFKTHL